MSRRESESDTQAARARSEDTTTDTQATETNRAGTGSQARDTDAERRDTTLPPHENRRAGAPDLVAARGGVSFGSILTGVMVALGATALFSAIIAGVLAAINSNDSVTKGDLAHGGLGGGIGVVVALFIAYLWGGYAAGRMARGVGVLNGVLVPIVALIIAAIIGAIVYALGATIDFNSLNLPFNAASLTHRSDVQTWSLILGIAALVAMLLGGFLGGGMGARWHTRLERDAINDPNKRGVRTKRI